MKALTVRPPWDHALLNGKRVENRPVRPPAALIGQRFVLHAGLSYDYDATKFIKATLGKVGPLPHRPLGVLFATVKLLGWVERDTGACRRQGIPSLMSSPELEWALTDPWFFGPVGLVLAELHVLARPIPARGMNGYWLLTGEVERCVLEQQGGEHD